MIRVAVSGAAGRMGRLVAGTLRHADGFDLVALFDPPHTQEEIEGLTVLGDRAEVAAAGAEVVIEFTTPTVVLGNLDAWHGLGLHAVVGTSGFDADRVARVRESWTEGPARCLIVPNFSIGAVVMMHLAERAAPHFAAAEVIELHHDRKVDAPSGTALATAERIGRAQPDQRREVESAESLPGARGASVAGIPVHAVRLPGYVAHQEVIFGGLGETLSIRHDTTDRTAFMPGVILAASQVATLPAPVTVGLEPLLGLA